MKSKTIADQSKKTMHLHSYFSMSSLHPLVKKLTFWY